MIFDFDDHHEGNTAWPELHHLKAIRPDFRATLFAVPGLGSPDFWASTPSWLELATHGWLHPDPHECQDWPKERLLRVMDEPIVNMYFKPLFKAPGWQISDGCYQALLERNWAVADQPYNNHRRPPGLRCHLLGSPDHHHHHIQDVCGNGIRETFPQLVEAVRNAPFFEFMSQAVDRAVVG